MSETYELIYWPQLPGRGEFVRLALEDAAANYIDVARAPDDNGVQKVLATLLSDIANACYAPPILRSGDHALAQTTVILAYLGPRLGLVGDDDTERLRAMQVQATIMDVVAEAHNVHHPISPSLSYEDQQQEAKRAAAVFVSQRLPKWFRYFARVCSDGFVVAGRHSYADLSAFQLYEGLRYAFPTAMAAYASESQSLGAVAERVQARGQLAAYLASDRRLAFNQDGVFRHYPALDLAP